MPLFINLTMSIEKKRGSYRNLREKLWIINFSEKNKKMYVEEDADGNEEFVDLVLVPVEENDGPPVDLEVLENRPKKAKIQSKITAFFH